MAVIISTGRLHTSNRRRYQFEDLENNLFILKKDTPVYKIFLLKYQTTFINQFAPVNITINGNGELHGPSEKRTIKGINRN